ncbi:MAG: HEAT repeat domain-containing protein [Gemmatimonadetes bacterium]|nr:HEAT repeat domain-containing protein [Gemmatimonadota bacterium]
MSDLARSPMDAPETAAESDVSPNQVSDLLVAFGKALRAHQLYDVNNPVYQRFVGALRSAFAQVWARAPELTLAITEDAITWNGAQVYRGDSRSDSLAFLFYKDGIRALTFAPGFEDEDLEGFLEVLHRARHLRSEEDDLLTLLWERDFGSVRYSYVDLFTEGADVPEPSGEEPAPFAEMLRGELETAEAVAEGEEAAGTEVERPPAPVASIKREDFDATLYFLDERELRYLGAEVERETERDLRGGVLAALFDRLEEPKCERQSEILGILRTLLPNFLSRGALGAVAGVLRELDGLVRRGSAFDEKRGAEVDALMEELSSASTIEELVRAIEAGAITPSVEELGTVLQYLRAGALGPLIRAAEEVRQKELRSLLGQAVERIAQQHQASLVSHLKSEDPIVAAGAARLVGRLGLTEAAGEVAALLANAAPEVRLAAVEAAVALRSGRAAEALQEALMDPERDVRIAAARGLGSLRYQPARDRLAEIIAGRTLRDADLTESIAFFEAFGSLGGNESVGLLDRLLNGRGFLGRRESSEIRACAALGLGRIRTADATKALQAAAPDEDPIVRSAVGRALRGEG